MFCPAWSNIQSVDSMIVSVIITKLMDMESVIKSNTKGMKEIVTKLEKAVKEKNKEIDQLKKLNEELAVDNNKTKKEVSTLEIKNTEELKLKKAFQRKRKMQTNSAHADVVPLSRVCAY